MSSQFWDEQQQKLGFASSMPAKDRLEKKTSSKFGVFFTVT